MQWQSGWIRNGPSIWLSRFMFDDGHGLTSNNGEVDWLSSSSSTAFTILDRTISPVDFASGRGHGLLWNKNNGDHGWIMSFAADAGAPATLFSAPSGTWINVARLTDDRIAWISVSGPRTSEFIYTAARFDWMKYVFDGVSFLTLSEPPGPNIPAYTGLFDLASVATRSPTAAIPTILRATSTSCNSRRANSGRYRGDPAATSLSASSRSAQTRSFWPNRMRCRSAYDNGSCASSGCRPRISTRLSRRGEHPTQRSRRSRVTSRSLPGSL